MKKITLLTVAFLSMISLNAQTTLFTADFSVGDLSEFDQVINSASTENWTVTAVGTHDFAANVNYDPALVPQDEQLITPSLDLSSYVAAELEFNWFASYHWSVAPNDHYDLNVLISTDGGSTYTKIWDETMGQQFASTADNFLWLEERIPPQPLEIVDLSPYIGMSDVKISFQYLGSDGAQGAFDDITVRASTSAGVEESLIANFEHFYNASNQALTLSADEAFSQINLYNILGQQVISKKLSSTEEVINLASLNTGVYLANVNVNGKTATFKIVKR